MPYPANFLFNFTIRLSSLALGLLLTFQANGQTVEEDGWGPEPAIKIADYKEEVIFKGENVIYKASLRNVTSDTILLYNFSIAGPKAEVAPQLKKDFTIQQAVRLNPGTEHLIATVTAPKKLHPVDLGITYNHLKLNNNPRQIGKPGANRDYAFYHITNESNTETGSYFINLSGKPIVLAAVTENALAGGWARNSTYSGTTNGMSYQTTFKYSGKPVTLAPGQTLLVWKEKMFSGDFEFVTLNAKADFAK